MQLALPCPIDAARDLAISLPMTTQTDLRKIVTQLQHIPVKLMR